MYAIYTFLFSFIYVYFLLPVIHVLPIECEIEIENLKKTLEG